MGAKAGGCQKNFKKDFQKISKKIFTKHIFAWLLLFAVPCGKIKTAGLAGYSYYQFIREG
ncbi:MAG: hypothetical protein LBG83_08145 [Oscillospiraceae bacterium]|jgi:hypothetical protein|nr:hypothetical protein [Oscillospiraceae bacterium]